ncbi:MAG: hypothetical protein QOD71_1607 [Thermoleophilaceae bacterium]|jgi:hypothetical protein|nr:hypothetical protein [Thermoleophilaceae bacterium]
MSVHTSDSIQTFLTDYTNELNAAVASRAFPPFVQKWFAVGEDCSLTFSHETQGLANAVRLWDHLLPKGMEEGAPREVLQWVDRIEDGRVYSHRQLQGGNAPRPLYGLQQTQFDDRTLISEIKIESVQDEPRIESDPEAARSRLGRIFVAFAEAFNEFFMSGDSDLVVEWCSPDIKMAIDSTFWGMGVIMPHNRIAKTARFTLEGFEQVADDRVVAQVSFVDWGGLDGMSPWELAFTPDLKVRELVISLEI